MFPTFPPNLNLQETGNKSAKLSMCIVSGNNLLPKQVVVINCCQKSGCCGNKMLQQILPEPMLIAAIVAILQLLEPGISATNLYCGNIAAILPQHFHFGKDFHGPRDVRAIEVRL